MVARKANKLQCQCKFRQRKLFVLENFGHAGRHQASAVGAFGGHWLRFCRSKEKENPQRPRLRCGINGIRSKELMLTFTSL